MSEYVMGLLTVSFLILIVGTVCGAIANHVNKPEAHDVSGREWIRAMQESERVER